MIGPLPPQLETALGAIHEQRAKIFREYVNVFSLLDTPTFCKVLSLKYLTRIVHLWHADAKSLFITLVQPYKSVSP